MKNLPGLGLFRTFLPVVALTCSFSISAPAESGDTGKIFHANADSPGSAIDLKSVLSNRVTTLLFIHSPHCGPCKRMEPKIKKLANLKTDLRIVDMTLDKRTDPGGIGWDSPAARQFDIRAVPAFMIFDQSGKLISRGDNARAQLNNWLVETGLEKNRD